MNDKKEKKKEKKEKRKGRKKKHERYEKHENGNAWGTNEWRPRNPRVFLCIGLLPMTRMYCANAFAFTFRPFFPIHVEAHVAFANYSVHIQRHASVDISHSPFEISRRTSSRGGAVCLLRSHDILYVLHAILHIATFNRHLFLDLMEVIL